MYENDVNLVEDDATALGLDFKKYEASMTGGYAVLLVVNPYNDYH